jgi:streptogramin lyase
MSRISRVLVVFAVVATGLGGCEKRREAGELPPPPGPSAAPLPQGPPAPLAELPAAPVGPAYFGTNGLGLLKLENGEFTTVFDKPDYVSKLAVGPDGTLWIANVNEIVKWKDGATTTIAGGFSDALPNQPRMFDLFVLDGAGGVWTAGYGEVGHFDGAAWTTWPMATVGPKIEGLEALAVDGAGRVWLAASRSLHGRKADGTWEEIDLRAFGPREVFLSDLAVGPDGKLHVLFNGGLLRQIADGFALVPVGDTGTTSLDHLALAPDGSIYMGGYDTLAVVPAAGGVPHVYTSKAGKDFDGAVNELAVDARGRAWILTLDAGIAIIDRAGQVTRWKPGTFAALAVDVGLILPVAGGPELPTPGAVKIGALQGKVIKGGVPLAGVTVEVCAIPASMFRETPCAEAPFHQSTKTAADGSFSFPNVPLGTYGFAVLDGTEWAATMGHWVGGGMVEGQTYDVGALELSE